MASRPPPPMMLNVGGRMIPLSQAATMNASGFVLPGTGGSPAPVAIAPLGRPTEHALASHNSARRQGKPRRQSVSSATTELLPAAAGGLAAGAPHAAAGAASSSIPQRRTSAPGPAAAAAAIAAATGNVHRRGSLGGSMAVTRAPGFASQPPGSPGSRASAFLDWLEASSEGRFDRSALEGTGFVYLRVGRHLYDLELSTGLESGAVRPRPAATAAALAADAAAERAARFAILSAQGMTCHIEGEAAFVAADQFEVDWARYQTLVARPFFRRFRAWRVFELWKRGLRQRRLAARRADLERALFSTDVTLRPALLEVRRYCLSVTAIKLFSVEAATFSLRDWLEHQENARHAAAAVFGETFGEVRRLVIYAAAVSLGRYMRELGLDTGGHALMPVLTGSAAPPPMAAAAAAASQLGAPKYYTMFAMPKDLRYTTRAAARTQCRRLLRFVRLADLSLWAALQSLAFSSCTMLLSNMSATSPAERRQRANAGDSKVRAAVRNAGGARGAAAAVTDDAIAMFSTELCGRLPNAAAAAAAAVAAAAPEADAASGSDVSAVPAAATGSTFRLRLADSVTGIDDLSNAAASGEEDEVAADDGGLTFVVSAAANMNGLFFQPDEVTCVSRVEVAICEALRVIATAMCTRLASSDDFKVLRAALARRKPRADGGAAEASDDGEGSDAEAVDGEDRGGASDDDDDGGRRTAARTRSPRAGAPGSPRPATSEDVQVEVFDASEGLDQVLSTAAPSRPAAADAKSVDGAAVARISQQIPRTVAIALGLVPPGTASATARGGGEAAKDAGAPAAADDDGDLPLDAAGLLSPALCEALELLVPTAAAASGAGGIGGADESAAASSAGLTVPTQGGLAISLRGLLDSSVVKSSMAGIRAVLANAFAAATAYAESFQQYRQVVVTDTRMLHRLSKDLLATQPVATVAAALTAIAAQIALCEEAPESRSIGQLLRVDSMQLKQGVRPAPRAFLDALTHLLPQVAMERSASLLTEVMAANSRLRVEFRSVDEYVSLTTALHEIQGRLDGLLDRDEWLKDLTKLCATWNFGMADSSWRSMVQSASEQCRKLRDTVAALDEKADANTAKFAREIEAAVPKLRNAIAEVRRRTDDLSVHRPASRPKDVLALLAAVDADATELDAKAKSFQRYQAVLKLPIVPFDDMAELRTDLNAKRHIWQTTQDWLAATDAWFATSLAETDVVAIGGRVTQFARAALACERELPGNPVVAALRERLAAFRAALPIVVDLRCAALKQRHWDEIQGVLGFAIKGDPAVTVGMVIRRGATRFGQQLARIAGEATAESQLEVSLAGVMSVWASLEFTLLNFRGSRESLILGDLSEVESALDESLVELTTLLGSRYITHLRPAVEAFQTRLTLLDDICAELIVVQRHWVYLEQVFSSSDIQRQLPTESKAFTAVDNFFRDLMRKIRDDSNCLTVALRPGLLDVLRRHATTLDIVRAQLDQYLELKRTQFPRFYFLSNDELIEILATAGVDPRAVQPHLLTLFDAVARLHFDDEAGLRDALAAAGSAGGGGGSAPTDGSGGAGFAPPISAVLSPEGEVLHLVRSIKPRGQAEDWLTQVEAGMKATLRKAVRDAVGQLEATLEGAAELPWVVRALQALQVKEEAAAALTPAPAASPKKRAAPSLTRAASMNQRVMAPAALASREAAYTAADHRAVILETLAERRAEWIISHVSQASAVVAQVMWTRGTEEALEAAAAAAAGPDTTESVSRVSDDGIVTPAGGHLKRPAAPRHRRTIGSYEEAEEEGVGLSAVAAGRLQRKGAASTLTRIVSMATAQAALAREARSGSAAGGGTSQSLLGFGSLTPDPSAEPVLLASYFELGGEPPLRAWLTRIVTDLAALTHAVRATLTPLNRTSLTAMLTTGVHARDVAERLLSDGVTSAEAFQWEMQLRYYITNDELNIAVRHGFTTVNYGYEYQGCTPRLVITPLTDRCWLTISGAFRLKLGCAPAGPAGTGKTESSKDLAKGLAIQCIVFNCSEQVDYVIMGRLFSGLAQTGAWACLDEFNRMNLEVLSVISAQLQQLRRARLAELDKLVFEGRAMPLREHHIVVTMNPGYAGRTELPDNLKVLFRPCTMMAADVTRIAEVTLLAEGFDEAKVLALKIVQLYTLCAEQLSRQQHYDWGMRALKSVLLLAGALKREAYVTINERSGRGGSVRGIAASRSVHALVVSEDNIIMRALSDANVPKLVGEDVLLFYGLIMDLFPFDVAELHRQVEDGGQGAGSSDLLLAQERARMSASASKLPIHALTAQQAHLPSWMRTVDSSRARSLVNALDHTLRLGGLQQPPAFVRKIMQLDATLHVRFGTALVGGAGTGKTTMVTALAHAVSCIAARGAIAAFAERAKSSRASSRRQGAPKESPEAAIVAAGHGKASQPHGVKVHVLNPKSVSLEGLFGRGNSATGEWQDGLLSKLMRDASRNDVVTRIAPDAYRSYNISADAFADLQRADLASEPPTLDLPCHTWLLVDGPIDSVWIESINSVLDDSRTLCLSNNERVKLSPNMRLLFEVGDLSSASPAAVSRLGVIFVAADDLGWQAFAQSWIARPDVVAYTTEKVRARLLTHFAMLDSVLAFLRGRAPLPSSEVDPAATAAAPAAAAAPLTIGIRSTAEGTQPQLVPQSDLGLIASLCSLLHCLIVRDMLTPANVPPTASNPSLSRPLCITMLDSSLATGAIDRMFVFAVIWALGATLAPDRWRAFDVFLRDLLRRFNLDAGISPNATVFDFYLRSNSSSAKSSGATMATTAPPDDASPYALSGYPAPPPSSPEESAAKQVVPRTSSAAGSAGQAAASANPFGELSFRSWNELLPASTYDFAGAWAEAASLAGRDSAARLSDVFVPTIDAVRFGELISMLYFNPWATGAAGAGLPAVSLAHRPVYLTSHGPAGKSTMLRLLLARTKLRQAKGVAALLSPTSTEDDEANAALRASGVAASEDPVAPTMASGGAARRSSATLSAAPAVPAPPVKAAFLPFLTTHWLSMPRSISAASFQGAVVGHLDRRTPSLLGAPVRPTPKPSRTEAAVNSGSRRPSTLGGPSVDLGAKMKQRISGGDAPLSGRVATLSALRRLGEQPLAVAPGATPSANRLLVVIDDVSLNAPEAFGAHPPLEVLRFWLEHGGFYDTTKLAFNSVMETQWLLSGSASGGVALRHTLPDRLARHVHVLCMPSPSSDAIGTIFRSLVSGFLSTDLVTLRAAPAPVSGGTVAFSPDLRKAGEAAVGACLSLLGTLGQDVRPSPVRLQYSLDALRDVARVVDGIAQARPSQVDDATTFARLWLHESLRVFYDRMTSTRHQLAVSQAAVDCVSRFFHVQMRHDAVMAIMQPNGQPADAQPPAPAAAAAGGGPLQVRDRINSGPIIFGRFAHEGAGALGVAGSGDYEELHDIDAVIRVMYTAMSEHDMMHPSDEPMSDLVLFGEALNHVVRLARVLSMPRGHAVLLGLTGVGRTSCLSIAAVLAGVRVAGIEFANSSAVISPSVAPKPGAAAAAAAPGSPAAAVKPGPRKRRGDDAAAKFSHTGYGSVMLTGAHAEFRERLKQILFDVGVLNRPTALHVQHAQVVSPELDAMGTVGYDAGRHAHVTTDHDLIMADIHQLLECGEVPGLFEQGVTAGTADEVAAIVNEIRVQADRSATRIADREFANALESSDDLAGAVLSATTAREGEEDESFAPARAAVPSRQQSRGDADDDFEHTADPSGSALARATTRAECWEVFKTRVSANLHIVLSLSSAGGGVRARLRAYPSLQSHFYWDHFLDWSPDALVAVASLHLEKLTFALPASDFAPQGAAKPAKPPAAAAGDSSAEESAIDAADTRLRTSLSVAACNIYLTVPVACTSYNASTRRQVFVTPKSYFEWMTAFSNTWNARRNRLLTLLDRLSNGIATIESTNSLVGSLRVQLADMQPMLVQKRAEALRLLDEVSSRRSEAESIAVRVAEEEAEVTASAATAAELAAEAKRELDVAMPALDAAVAILETLDKKDIVEMKSFNAPPPAVRTVMEAVCVLLNETTDWMTAKRVLGSDKPNFIQLLQQYDKDNIDPAILRKLVRYTTSPTMAVESMKKVSLAAAGICMWVHAIESYAKAMRELAPKQARLATMNEALAKANEALEAKRKDLGAIQTRLSTLQKQADSVAGEKEGLEREGALSQQRMERANTLLSGLQSEGGRWRSEIARLEAEAPTLVGDIFLATASVAFAGPFSEVWRTRLSKAWVRVIQAFENPTERSAALAVPVPPAQRELLCAIPHGQATSLRQTLGDEVLIRGWQALGLPKDDVSAINALLVTHGAGVHLPLGQDDAGGRRWAYCIDPQGQAARWIAAVESSTSAGTRGVGGVVPARAVRAPEPGAGASSLVASGVDIVSVFSPQLPRALEACVRNGRALIIKDCGATLPPLLDPVLSRAVFHRDGRALIRIAGRDTDYDSRFRLYLMCPSAVVRLSPDVAVRVNVVDFTVSRAGLEDQLMGAMVAFDRPAVEAKANSLVVSIAADRKQLASLEDQVLSLLAKQSHAPVADTAGTTSPPKPTGGAAGPHRVGGARRAPARRRKSTVTPSASALHAILDDQFLINTLQTSRSLAAVIEERLVDTEATAKALAVVREMYRPAASRATLIYFVVSDLATVDPMYTISLPYYMSLFDRTLQDTPVALSPGTRQSLSTPSESETLTITTRVEAVMALTTRVVFFDVCRALFGKDKLLLALMIAVALHTYDMIESGQIRPAVLSTSGAGTAGNAALPELHLLLHGPSAGKVATEDSDAESRSLMPSASLLRELEGDSGDQTATPITSRSFVSSASIGSSSMMLVLSSSGRMLLAQAGSLVPAMRGILEHVQSHLYDWGEWVSLVSPQDSPLPASYPMPLTPLQRLLLLRAIAPHKSIAGIESYVRERLGPEYVSPPPVSILDLFRRMTPHTPAVLLLSQGRDPSDEVSRFAEVMGIRAAKSAGVTAGGRASIAGLLGHGSSISADVALPQLAQVSTRDRLHILSLGQGQGEKAEAVILAAAIRGDWVLLQNCHLATQWLPSLSRVIAAISEKPLRDVKAEAASMSSARGRKKGAADDEELELAVAAATSPSSPTADDGSGANALAGLTLLHPDFRLFLVSAPTASFPVTILQTAVKWSSEPPRGVAASLQRSFDLHIRPLLNGAATAAVAATAEQGSGGSGTPGHQSLAPVPPSRPRAMTLDAPPPKRSARLLNRGDSDAAPGPGPQPPAPAAEASGAPQHPPAGGERQILVAYASRRLACLTFALCHFHALLQERRRFGHVAFNDTAYEFADVDLDCALSTMRLMLEKDGDPGIRFQPMRQAMSLQAMSKVAEAALSARAAAPDAGHGAPASASPSADSGAQEALLSALLTHTFIRFQLADINYGGRVTDLWDQRTLRALYDFALHPYHPSASVTGAALTTFAGVRVSSESFVVQSLARLVPRVDADWAGDMVPVEEVFAATTAAVNALAAFGTARDAELVGLHANASVRSLQRDARLLFSSAAICSSMQAAAAGSISAHLRWASAAPIEVPRVKQPTLPDATEAAGGAGVAAPEAAPPASDAPAPPPGGGGGRRDSLVVQAQIAHEMRSAMYAARGRAVTTMQGPAMAPTDSAVRTTAASILQGLPAPLPIRALLPRRKQVATLDGREFLPNASLPGNVPMPQRTASAQGMSEAGVVTVAAAQQHVPYAPEFSLGGMAEFIEEPDDDDEEGGGEAAGGGAPDAAGVTRSRTPGPSHNRLDVAVGRDLLRAAGIDPYRVVLRHECRQYNALLDAMRVSLGRLLEAVDGMTSLDAELEAVHDALARNAVPPEWASLAFSCNKPLSSWFSELLQNVAFFAGWAGSPRADPPAAFRLGAFCFPQALLSAVLQSYARRTQVSIDQLTFSTQVLPPEYPGGAGERGDMTDRSAAPPPTERSDAAGSEGGIILVGLHLEGAAWDADNECLSEMTPGQLTVPCPPVRLVPRLRSAPPRPGAPPVYVCPVYRTSTRKASSIDTGGFVVAIELPVRPPPLAAAALGNGSSTARRRQLGLTVQTGAGGAGAARSMAAMNRRPSLPQVDQSLEAAQVPLSAVGSVSDDTAFVLRGTACVCNPDE